jgi:hypothetical protein
LADLAVKKDGADRWFLLTKALAEYRMGRQAGAIGWLKRVAPKANGEHLDAAAFVILALAQHQLVEVEESRAALGRAQAILAKKMPNPAKGERFGVDWHDWLRSQILCRQAEALIGTDDNHRKDTKDAKEKP